MMRLAEFSSFPESGFVRAAKRSGQSRLGFMPPWEVERKVVLSGAGVDLVRWWPPGSGIEAKYRHYTISQNVPNCVHLVQF